MSRLSGQAAIVTGGAQGIGGATSRRLAEEGAAVLVADVDLDTANATAAAIADTGGRAVPMLADVSRAEDIEAMVAKAVEEFGRLDILVNNAVSADLWGGNSPITDISEANFDAGMGILVKAHFLATKQAVPYMEATGGGSIVNISSVHGMLAAPGALIYETGKHAVIGITRQMATELGPVGIRVNAICPGHIVTERAQEGWKDNPAGLEFFVDQYPVGRTGRPVDIANAVVFLCSEEASFITGHALVVDGGLTAQLQENLGVKQGHYIRANPDVRLPY